MQNNILENEIKDILKEFGIGADFSADKNLLELGLSSIQLMRIVSRLRKKGVKCSFVDLLSRPYLRDWKEYFSNQKSDAEGTENNSAIAEENIDMHEPFPMTDVQNAYWIGRSGGQQIGNVGCHGYMEVDCEHLDTERLNKAFYDLQMHHPMLRAVVTSEGLQKIVDTPYTDNIKVYDYSKGDAKEHLEKMREEYSHRLLDIYHGQVIALQVTLLPKERARIHFDIDLLIADVTSFQIILRDLVRLYNGGVLEPEGNEFNFAQYIRKEELILKDKVEEDREYWTKRLETMSGKPELPVKNTDTVQPKFVRRDVFMEPDKWEKFRKLCAAYQVTPAIVLLTLYGKAVVRFSENSRFLINLPLFNRSSEYPGMEHAVADFTKLLLMEFDYGTKLPFCEEILRVRDEFQENMRHNDYSGVDVQREYLKQHREEEIVAPIVFSCNLGVPLLNDEFMDTFGNITYMISQTPQVWLDFQLFDLNDGLLMIWDSVEEIFEPTVLDEMFRCYQKLLEKAVDMDNWEQELEVEIDEQLKKRREFEIVDEGKKGLLLHGGFFEYAERVPDAVALIDSDDETEVTYGELRDEALRIASILTEMDVSQDARVGVCLKRGKEQIAAVLGILAVGAAYVTIGYTQPLERRKAICSLADIRVVITAQEQKESFPNQAELLFIDDVKNASMLHSLLNVSADCLAYIIFTSGSTGVPKGVMIRHDAAMNTIQTMNEMYGISEKDTVLQVSAMDFDLSVYDIFGLLSVGGKVVLIPQGSQVDAKELYRRSVAHRVTVWNSVPALLEMMLIVAEDSGEKNHDLRLAFISGDWIPMDLPKRFNTYAPMGKFVSLGGATEGSIWSNYYEVNLPIPETWSSIPYGHPLKNQAYRVVNDRGEDCPDYVRGELWIGGEGVASGYVGNESETEKRFLECKENRWYRTGDYGRFWKDGTIEFLGRMDHQVKIRGHRIETEEIENIFLKNDKVAQAVVLPVGENKAEHLAAFLVPVEKMVEEKMPYMNIVCREGTTVAVNEPDEAKVRQLTARYILSFFEQYGIEWKKGAEFTFDVEHEIIGISPLYRQLVKSWLQLLVDENLIEKIDEGKYRILCNLGQVGENISIPEYEKLAEHTMKNAMPLIRGTVSSVETILSDEEFDMQKFVSNQPGNAEKKKLVLEIAGQYVDSIRRDRKQIKVLVLGARDIAYIRKIAEKLVGTNAKLTVLDTSVIYLDQLKDFIDSEHVELKKIDEKDFCNNKQTERYDLAISFDYLHQLSDVESVLQRLSVMLNDNGMLLFSEVTANSSIQLVTTAMIEEGFSKFTDSRKNTMRPLFSSYEWEKCLEDLGYIGVKCYQPVLNIKKQNVFIAFHRNRKEVLETDDMLDYIAKYVPEYMIPKFVFIMDSIPRTANGKTDRKELLKYVTNLKESKERNLPEGELDKELAELWKQILKVSEIYMEDDFYLLGGDSLMAVRLKNALKKDLGYDVPLEAIFKKSEFSGFVDYIKHANADQSAHATFPQVTYRPEEAYEVFPLTDVQNAYWIGRNGGYELGDVSSHCYFEMDSDSVAINELEDTWNQLIAIHGMMRAVILPDGSGQKILPQVEKYCIAAEECNTGEINEYVRGVRKQMSSQKYDSSVWPLFEVRVTYYDNHKSMRLHLSFDNIVFDGFSIFRLFMQWKQLWEGNDISICKNLTYRDYVLAQEKIKTTEQYKKDLDYWKEKVKHMYPAPTLPMSDSCQDYAFSRYEYTMKEKDWKKIEEICSKNHLTLPVVLMTAYSEVLARYSTEKQFTLNLTRFQKLPLDPEVDDLIGDFTTLTLLEIDFKNKNSFLARCKAVQEQLHADMEHSLVSGVEVERELAKVTGKSGVTMPVVFTSGIGIQGESRKDAYFGEIVYGESQTPQVWLDNQVSIQNGKMVISWDAVKGMFPNGLVDDMFAEYKLLLASLGKETAFTEIGSNRLKVVAASKIEQENNSMDNNACEENMIEAFKRSVEQYPDRMAVWTTHKVMTYKELDLLTDKIAKGLITKGVKENDTVAIVMEKGIYQVVAALAVMKAGACYVPVDPHNPAERIRGILEKSRTSFAIADYAMTQQGERLFEEVDVYVCETLAEVASDDVLLPEISADASAYIIFTSGSTGIPKGVEISHVSAMNTIMDINERFGVRETDATILLSNLNFDLSVYDIFGMLSCGGHIVIPDYDKTKDPAHWMDIMNRGCMTIWNTVPAFMQMLTEYHVTRNEKINAQLRLVLLSGDWIPVDLPEKIYEMFGDIEQISLGGATEASIWSNYFRIPKEVPKEWTSIPYGKPLKNQGFLILNNEMERVPVWIQGELYITGYGVAKGYVNDEEKTAESFINIPGIDGKVYKTGDYGRYLPDGNIQFLGRLDHQVKRGGHRIELGEIEVGLNKILGIKQAVVTFQKGNDDSLTAHIIPERDNRQILLQKQERIIDEKSLPQEKKAITDESVIAVKQVENVARYNIFKDFCEWGILNYLNEKHTVEDILEYFSIKQNFSGLIRNNLYALCDLHVVQKCGDQYKILNSTYEIKEEKCSLGDRLEKARPIRWQLLTGEKEVKDLMLNRCEDFIYPEQLKQFMQDENDMHGAMLRFVEIFAMKSGGSIMEIASRTENHTEIYAEAFRNAEQYLYCDESSSMLEKKQAVLGDERISYHLFHPMQKAAKHGIPLHSMSLIIAENTLHRYPNMDEALWNLKELLVPGGCVLIMENTVNSPLMLETVAYFEEGYHAISDARSKVGLPLLSAEEWRNYALANGYKEAYIYLNRAEEEKAGKNIILLEGPDMVEELNVKYVKEELAKWIPSYMLPVNYVMYEEFPLSTNGKINRKEMEQVSIKCDRVNDEIVSPRTDVEKCIAEIWAELLKCSTISVKNGFFELGGDSLKAIRFVNQLKEKSGYNISLQLIATYPVLEELAANVEKEICRDDDEDEWDEVEEII